MARIDPDLPLEMSVLDRLIDEDPTEASDARRSRGHYLADLRNAIRRDLENLLNVHQRFLSWPEALNDLETSLVGYGIPDFFSTNLAAHQARETFREEVETVIRRFETRFQSVKVVLPDSGDGLERVLRFRIEAMLQAYPAPEPMVFESQLDPGTRAFSVRASQA